MFDPQYTRRSNRRFYTRKGQVIQAKATDSPVVIEQRLIPIYQEYFRKNSIEISPPQPPTIPPFYILSPTSKLKPNEGSFTIPLQANMILITIEGQEIKIFYLYNNSGDAIETTLNGVYIQTPATPIPFINEQGDTIFELFPENLVSQTEPVDPTMIIPNTPGLILNEIESST